MRIYVLNTLLVCAKRNELRYAVICLMVNAIVACIYYYVYYR